MIYHVHHINGRDENWIATFAKREDAEGFLERWNAEHVEFKACLIPQKRGV